MFIYLLIIFYFYIYVNYLYYSLDINCHTGAYMLYKGRLELAVMVERANFLNLLFFL